MKIFHNTMDLGSAKILPHEKYPLSGSLYLLRMCLGYMHVTCACLVSQCPGSEDDSDEREVPPAEGEGPLHPRCRSCDTSTYHVLNNTCHAVGGSSCRSCDTSTYHVINNTCHAVGGSSCRSCDTSRCHVINNMCHADLVNVIRQGKMPAVNRMRTKLRVSRLIWFSDQ